MPKKPKAKAAPVETPPVAPVEAPVAAPVAEPVVEERRVEEPEAEVLSLAVAEEVGALPAEDRRAPEPAAEPVVEAAPAPVLQNDEIHVVRQREDGTKVTATGSILDVDPPRVIPPPRGKGFE